MTNRRNVFFASDKADDSEPLMGDGDHQGFGDGQPESDGNGSLRELMQDLHDMRTLAHMMGEFRQGAEVAVCSTNDGPRELDGAGHEDISHEGDDLTDLIVELRLRQLLAMPFGAAMRRCSALRRHVEGQEDHDEVASEFEEFWSPDAPVVLVSVLESLLREEWSQDDVATGSSNRRLEDAFITHQIQFANVATGVAHRSRL
jgi:hypothetical protein